MIHILYGDDTKSRSTYIKELTREREASLASSDVDKDFILNSSASVSLFGGLSALTLDNILNEEKIIFSTEELNSLKKSDTIFIFKEDKLSVADQKKYKKYAEIKSFENKKVIIHQKFNVFDITNAIAKRDKVVSWTLYRKAIDVGVEPEAISGAIFWKIKMMILNGSNSFTKDELKHMSSQIVFMYHMAHRGELDFTIALEQFVLSSLSSKKSAIM